MQWAWTLGRIAGIEIKIHVTFVLLLVWIGASHVLAGEEMTSALGAVGFILLLFCIVVLHELGHALTARHFGIRTRDITLLPIGGVARLERMPEKPRQELAVALAGPAVNVLLAAILLGVILGVGADPMPDDLGQPGSALLPQLLWLNVGLATFNLLPAFPMDGGRALRALLALRMDGVRATQIAATLGQAIALGFGLLGLFTNPMLLFIALFVWLGAAGEAKLAQLRGALDGVPVAYAMIGLDDIRVLHPDDPISAAVDHVLAGFQEDFPVMADHTVIGVLTKDDLLRTLASEGPNTPVAKAMRTSFKTAHPREMLERALADLQACGCPSMPVVDDTHRLVGLITMQNIGELVMIHSALASRSRRRPTTPA